MPAAGLLRRTKPGKVWRQESRFMKKRATVILFLLVCILLSVSAQAAEAEQDTAWSVSVLQKTGSDEENMVFLIFAEGYTQAQQEQFWEDARVRFAGMLQYEPYRSYAGRINAYAVFAPSNEAGVSDKYGDTVDTYFGVVAIGKTLKFREQFYLDRANAIRSYMEETILDGSASVTTMHFLINTTASVGSSSGVMYSFSALGEDTADGSAMTHEMSHSLGKLGDEYGYSTSVPNLSNTADPDAIKWKELLGFRGVRIVPGNAEGRYIPTNQKCMMYTLGEPFCEVCKLQLARRFSEWVTDGPAVYVAQPEVTTEHSRTADSANYRVTQANLLRKAPGATLELRTVVQNLTDSPRTLRLHLAILGQNGIAKEEVQEDFVLPALTNRYDMESACIYPSVKKELREDLTVGDRLIGEVLEVLPDGSSRLLDTYVGQEFETVTVQYLTEDGQTVPGTFAAQVPLAKGAAPDTLAPQTLLGRKFVSSRISGRTLSLIYGQQEAAPVTVRDASVSADGTLTFRVTGGSGHAAVIAAQYTNGRMVECRTAQTELPMQGRLVMSFAALPGAEYQIFILDGKTFEPLCARTNVKDY